MELLTPQLGLFFWTLVIFLTFFLVLRRFAWKPILQALHTREESIDQALKQADTARKELENLTSKNEEQLRQAREERNRIIQEAEEMKRSIVHEAQERAKEEVARRIAGAEKEIFHAKEEAMKELKNTAGQLALQVAEQLLRKELAKGEEQQRVVNALIEELNVTPHN